MVCVARIFDKSWSDRESRRRRSLVHDVKLDLGDAAPVSYTHLTLPTILRV